MVLNLCPLTAGDMLAAWLRANSVSVVLLDAAPGPALASALRGGGKAVSLLSFKQPNQTSPSIGGKPLPDATVSARFISGHNFLLFI
ncbi:hypothetical protein GCM10023069_12700 [Shinella granuli]